MKRLLLMLFVLLVLLSGAAGAYWATTKPAEFQALRDRVSTGVETKWLALRASLPGGRESVQTAGSVTGAGEADSPQRDEVAALEPHTDGRGVHRYSDNRAPVRTVMTIDTEQRAPAALRPVANQDAVPEPSLRQPWWMEDPGLAAQWDRARRLAWQGDLEQALVIMRGLASEHPSAPNLHGELGNLEWAMGHVSDAAAHYQHAMEAWLQVCRFDRAMMTARLVAWVDPQSSEALQRRFTDEALHARCAQHSGHVHGGEMSR
ncbi:hypothetical protein Tgr7_1746 [Thioalkalivibrio sulfidiphilus HL-EbGr7]|uniref:Tetratricopeptide repeat protein n=2 Tax=Thioalkalivibrio TaxID=106633 RepID=B8GSC4_THISH|nr:hypothetical protein Tgr7_1746 [Thioalkalivibrio sulfidiphilus HL-EbGr7]